MSMRCGFAWLLAAALALSGAAHAKPPDLPVIGKVECHTQPQEQPGGPLLFGLGVQSQSGLTGTIVLGEPGFSEESDEPPLCVSLDCVWNCLCEVVDRSLAAFASCFADEEPPPPLAEPIGEFTGQRIGLDFDRAVPSQVLTQAVPVTVRVPGGTGQPAVAVVEITLPIGPGQTQVTDLRIASVRILTEHGAAEEAGQATECPYLKCRPTERTAAGSSVPPELARGVLENLERLERAEALCRKAERAARKGKLDRACRCYQEVCEICPGSRHSREAAEQLQVLLAQRALEAARSDAEEQEPRPTSRQPELLPPPREVPDGQPQALRPTLPPVDPETVEALERLLHAVGDPALVRLVLAADASEQR